MEKAGGVKGDVSTNVTVRKFCLLFAEIPLQLVSRRTRRGDYSISRLVYDDNFDTGELCWHVKGTDGCKRIQSDSGDEKIAEKGLTKETVKTGSKYSTFGARLYRTDVTASLRRQMTMCSLQEVISGSQSAREGTRHSVRTLHVQRTQTKMGEGVVELRSSEVGWNGETSQFRRSFAGLPLICTLTRWRLCR